MPRRSSVPARRRNRAKKTTTKTKATLVHPPMSQSGNDLPQNLQARRKNAGQCGALAKDRDGTCQGIANKAFAQPAVGVKASNEDLVVRFFLLATLLSVAQLAAANVEPRAPV